jgi:segregation and condensation protein B
MPSRPATDDLQRTGVLREEQPPLPFDSFAEPDDQGLSLDELSQTYAALLQKGADPYAEKHPAPAGNDLDTGPEHTADQSEVVPVLPRHDETASEICPKSILEAILFVGHPTGEPLISERIAALMRGVRPAEIDDLVEELNEQYAAEGAPYTIVSVGPGYHLTLRPQFAPLRDAFHGRIREARLSQAALDVLAIVAYHQPIAQDAIEGLRDKPSGAILAQLVRRDLLAIERPADRKKSPTYCTTQRFLGLCGLSDLGQLPRSQEIEREL